MDRRHSHKCLFSRVRFGFSLFHKNRTPPTSRTCHSVRTTMVAKKQIVHYNVVAEAGGFFGSAFLAVLLRQVGLFGPENTGQPPNI